MLYFSYVPQLEYHYPFFFASVQVYIQSDKYIKYDMFMFQLLELLSRSILIEILITLFNKNLEYMVWLKKKKNDMLLSY